MRAEEVIPLNAGAQSATGSVSPQQRAEIASLRQKTNATVRATVPALEDLLYEPLPVLDHGFVRVIDYMGDDAAIVQAARVSYGAGTKRKRDDAGLIRYLMRNRHTSPFEMCDIKLHVKLPIFVARQWIRHRTACLAGDSVLYFDEPAAVRHGTRRRVGIPLENFFRMWHQGSSHSLAKKKPTFLDRIGPEKEYTIPELASLVCRREEDLRNMVRDGRLSATKRETDNPHDPQIFVRGSDWIAWADHTFRARVEMRARLRRMHLRMCDETSGEIRHTQVTDIWQTGVRPVFRVTLDNGSVLKMTKDHLCLTGDGWMTLEQATSLRRRPDGGVSWRADAPAFAVNGLPAYQSREWMAARRAQGFGVTAIASDAGVSYHTIRKWLRRHDLRFTPTERARLSGKAQRGQRRTLTRRPWSEARRTLVRAARSGERSNFWRGGTSGDRALIGTWTTAHASTVHRANGFRCVLCGSKTRLNAHHVDPVWHAPARARDLDNLTTLCAACHSSVHQNELELALLDAVTTRADLADFRRTSGAKRPRHPRKRRPTVGKLARGWASIARIEYAGEEMTFDLSVAGPFHNFVANGFVVHNSVNEYSARYSILDREFYLPEPEMLAAQSTNDRQGRGEVLDAQRASLVLDVLRRDAEMVYARYEQLLGETATGVAVEDGIGLARELARMDLTLNFYTQWYWKTNLHNLLHFLQLRTDPHAQYEIRAYAERILEIVRAWVPSTYEAFVDYRLGAYELSSRGLAVVSRMLKGEHVDQPSSGMSPGEWRALMAALGRPDR